MSSAVSPGLARLLDHLRLIEDRSERIELLIEIADRFRDVPPSVAQRPFPRERLVPACESEAYFWPEDLERPGGPFRIHFAVENPQGISARAMAVILDENLSGRPLTELAALSTDLPVRDLRPGAVAGQEHGAHRHGRDGPRGGAPPSAGRRSGAGTRMTACV